MSGSGVVDKCFLVEIIATHLVGHCDYPQSSVSVFLDAAYACVSQSRFRTIGGTDAGELGPVISAQTVVDGAEPYEAHAVLENASYRVCWQSVRHCDVVDACFHGVLCFKSSSSQKCEQ